MVNPNAPHRIRDPRDGFVKDCVDANGRMITEREWLEWDWIDITSRTDPPTIARFFKGLRAPERWSPNPEPPKPWEE
jgi:hypothetical protein